MVAKKHFLKLISSPRELWGWNVMNHASLAVSTALKEIFTKVLLSCLFLEFRNQKENSYYYVPFINRDLLESSAPPPLPAKTKSLNVKKKSL